MGSNAQRPCWFPGVEERCVPLTDGQSSAKAGFGGHSRCPGNESARMSMAGRALALTIVMAAGLSAMPARAQDINEGRTPPQLFAAVCSACHQSPRGLGRQIGAASLVNFLRQHYTTSREQAAMLAAYLHSSTNEPPAGAQRSGAVPRGQGPRQSEEGRPADGQAVAPANRRRTEEGRAGQQTPGGARQPRTPETRPTARSRAPAQSAIQTQPPVSPSPQSGEPANGPTSAIPATDPSTARTDDIAD
jgi:hypothetical protein